MVVSLLVAARVLFICCHSGRRICKKKSIHADRTTGGGEEGQQVAREIGQAWRHKVKEGNKQVNKTNPDRLKHKQGRG